MAEVQSVLHERNTNTSSRVHNGKKGNVGKKGSLRACLEGPRRREATQVFFAKNLDLHLADILGFLGEDREGDMSVLARRNAREPSPVDVVAGHQFATGVREKLGIPLVSLDRLCGIVLYLNA